MGHRTSVDEELTRVEGDAGVLLYQSKTYRYQKIGGPHFVKIVIGTMLVLSFIIVSTFLINSFYPLQSIFFDAIVISCLLGFSLFFTVFLWIIKSMPFRIYSNGIALDSVPLIKGLQRTQPLILNTDILEIRYDLKEVSRFHSGLAITYKFKNGTKQRKIGYLEDIPVVLIWLRRTNDDKFDEDGEKPSK